MVRNRLHDKPDEVSIDAKSTNSFDLVNEKSLESKVNKQESWLSRFLESISLQKNCQLSLSENFLLNEDLRPVFDIKERPWHWYNFAFLWFAESFNINTWQIASSGIIAGLSWWETWISVWVGYIILGGFIFISQRVGSHYHIPFPVSARSSFGTFGSIWPILNRVVMGCVWYSVQAWLGGESFALVLKAIFGASIEERIPNLIASSGTTSFHFLSFFLFCLVSLPFIYLRPQRVRHLFTVKAWTCAIAGIGFLVWTIVRAGGFGPVVHHKTTLTGSKHAWAFIISAMNGVSNFSTLIINSPDFSRMAYNPSSSSYSQLIAIPCAFSATALIGILASSASTSMFGETYWSPLNLLNRYVESGTAGDRAGVFFISATFVLAQIGANISANSISVGTDGSALLPRYINIRRGGFICAIVAFCLCPWNFFTSAANFTTYLSAYAVFLSSVAGVVAADYCVVRRGYINVFHLYSNKQEYNYSYNRFGINWRAYAAYICGILPNVVGFAGAVGATVPVGATYIYNISFFSGYICSFGVYCLLCWLSPVKGTPLKNIISEQGWYEQNIDYEVDDFIGSMGKADDFVRVR